MSEGTRSSPLNSPPRRSGISRREHRDAGTWHQSDAAARSETSVSLQRVWQTSAALTPSRGAHVGLFGMTTGAGGGAHSSLYIVTCACRGARPTTARLFIVAAMLERGRHLVDSGEVSRRSQRRR
jgi:hypothetical protein